MRNNPMLLVLRKSNSSARTKYGTTFCRGLNQSETESNARIWIHSLLDCFVTAHPRGGLATIPGKRQFRRQRRRQFADKARRREDAAVESIAPWSGTVGTDCGW